MDSAFTAPLPAAQIRLTEAVSIPQLGFGLYKVPDPEAEQIVGTALGAGYRHLDSAALYGNEAGVGRALSAAMSGGLAREDLFITSKVWNEDQGYESTLRAFDATRADLGLDYLDLYLIHWPCPARGLYLETYRALERLHRDGLVRAIGVSNFQPAHLDRLLQHAEIPPAVNQVELHPWLQQRELRAVHADLGIATEAWSPLARGRLLEDPTLTAIATTHGVSVAQVVIRWHLQEGNIVFPKASAPERIRANADVFDFALSQAELEAIAALERGFRSGSHPDDVT
ncbi:aldo/keto reductase [Zhihengliuella flava]|uniref:Diketogulonate reductase-like aldo/keto reductase n=1 Tax=Zhihengliuella flava TaxID=1285193 RepID=A0A931D7D7_9MICC|nr:aldo/keto reductase [Zhihengliuella flava]MBG6085045.1 diketogulonate reductase-like aldo/keto reductase [Zhihengliuella flava]